MRLVCVNGHGFDCDVIDERGEGMLVYFRMRGGIGSVVGVKKKDQIYCGKCHDQSKEADRRKEREEKEKKLKMLRDKEESVKREEK